MKGLSLPACLALAVAWPAGRAAATGAGSASGEFLNIATSTRAAAMGEAFVGVADDTGALEHNPGGLSRSRDMSFSYLHAFWLQSVGYDHLAAVLPFGRMGTAGISFTRLFADGESMAVGSMGEPVSSGRYNVGQTSVAVGWGYSIRPALAVGLALKGVSQDLAVTSASTMAVDAGLFYKTPIPELTTGLAITNVGGGMQGSSLPVYLKLGTGYALSPVKGIATLTGRRGLWDVPMLAADVLFPISPVQTNFIRVRLGAEYSISISALQSAALRLGYKFGEDGAGGLWGATAGLGYRMTSGRFTLGVDYALSHYGDLGLTHRLAFTTSFLHLSTVSFLAAEEQAKVSKREGQVYVEWPASTEAQVTGYNVYMGESKDADFVKVNRDSAVTGTSLSIKGLKIGKTYFFFVTTVVGVEPAIEGRPFFETSAVAQPVP